MCVGGGGIITELTRKNITSYLLYEYKFDSKEIMMSSMVVSWL